MCEIFDISLTQSEQWPRIFWTTLPLYQNHNADGRSQKILKEGDNSVLLFPHFLLYFLSSPVFPLSSAPPLIQLGSMGKRC